MPISHGEGKYYADAETLARLKQQNLVVFRYADADGRSRKPATPTARSTTSRDRQSRGHGAGHDAPPERASETAMGGTDGLLMFQSLLGSLVEDGTFLKR